MIKVKVGMKEYSIAAVVSWAIGALGIVSAAIGYADEIELVWPNYAWQTQARHTVDTTALYAEIDRLEQMIADSLMAATGATEDFRDEWKCDEYEEELIELLDLDDSGLANSEDRRRIERLRELTGPDHLNCTRFEEDD